MLHELLQALVAPQSTYCMHKMSGDCLWLSESFVNMCEAKYTTQIDYMNALHLFTSRCTQGAYVKDTDSFGESLYMLYSFFMGKLQAPPNGESLTNEYCTDSRIILIELCKRGVYTIYGVSPTSVVRSCHNFIVVINDAIQQEFIILLQTLFVRGVNVAARQVKRGHVVKEMVFANDCECLIHTEALRPISPLLPNGFHSSGHADHATYATIYSAVIDPDVGIGGMFMHRGRTPHELDINIQREENASREASLYYVETWSQTYDNFRVEDVLLQLWLEFNGDYGSANNIQIPA